MKTRLVLSLALLAVIASAGYATAPPSDPAAAPAEIDRPTESSATPVDPAPQAGLPAVDPEDGSAAVEMAPVNRCTDAAELLFEPLPVPAATCNCIRERCIIGGNCCGDVPDPFCGQKLHGRNRYAGRCDVLGCEGECCQFP